MQIVMAHISTYGRGFNTKEATTGQDDPCCSCQLCRVLSPVVRARWFIDGVAIVLEIKALSSLCSLGSIPSRTIPLLPLLNAVSPAAMQRRHYGESPTTWFQFHSIGPLPSWTILRLDTRVFLSHLQNSSSTTIKVFNLTHEPTMISRATFPHSNRRCFYI